LFTNPWNSLKIKERTSEVKNLRGWELPFNLVILKLVGAAGLEPAAF